MPLTQFEYPRFQDDGYGNYKADWNFKVDDKRAARLETVVKSQLTPGEVRYGLAKRAKLRNVDFGAVEKTFNSKPIIGARSNIFGICDATEYGYGIYTDPTDYANALLSWLDPLIVNDRRKFDIPILDFRNFFQGGKSGMLQDLICNPGGPALRGDIKRCRISYCFDQRGYQYCVDAAQLEDFQRDCFQQPPVNLWGTSIVNDPSQHQRLDDWYLLEGMKRHMVFKMLSGSWSASGLNFDGTPVKETTGLLNFVSDFTTRHGELAGNCAHLLPKTTALPSYPGGTPTAQQIADYWASVFLAIELRINEIEELVSRLGNGASTTDADRIIVMNWQDAQCIQWQQACLTACANALTYNVNMEAGGFSAAQVAAVTDFYNRFKMGQYGAGRIIFRSGRIVDIWAHPMFDYHATDSPYGIPRGDIHMFYKGWSGGFGGGNRNALRPIAFQLDEALNYYRNRSALPARYSPMLNGIGMKVLPLQPCDNTCVAWNLDVGFSNAPWMQTKFTGLQACTEVQAIAHWATTSPAITPNTLCTPN
jgi:hypothetical protein